MFKKFIIFLNIFVTSHANFSDTLQKQFLDCDEFFCDTCNGRSLSAPASVHKLRPGDIDIIAAIGDSLTAANGAYATDIFQVIFEARGKAFYLLILIILNCKFFLMILW